MEYLAHLTTSKTMQWHNWTSHASHFFSRAFEWMFECIIFPFSVSSTSHLASKWLFWVFDNLMTYDKVLFCLKFRWCEQSWSFEIRKKLNIYHPFYWKTRNKLLTAKLIFHLTCRNGVIYFLLHYFRLFFFCNKILRKLLNPPAHQLVSNMFKRKVSF